MFIHDSLTERYRRLRARWGEHEQGRASVALERARADIAAGRSTAWPRPLSFGAWNEDGARWCEYAPQHLRIAGYAPTERRPYGGYVVPDRERAGGWYMRADDWAATYTGVVVHLPARDGRTRFVPGHIENESGADGALIYWRDVFETDPGEDGRESQALRDCAARANHYAETAAEKSRDYDSAWQAGARWRDSWDESAQTRKALRELLRELKSAAVGAATCRALRAHVGAMLADLREEKEKRAALAAGEGIGRDCFGAFYTGDANLRGAFNDGAGRQVLS